MGKVFFGHFSAFSDAIRPNSCFTLVTNVNMINSWVLRTIFINLILRYSGLCMEASGPKLIENLPDQVDFSNNTGTTIDCRSAGNPLPSVKWVRSDNTPVTVVPGLRDILPNGSLQFLPFSATDYRQDIHASVYRCTAVNPLGTVISNDVKVRAAVKQFYEIQVYDQYVIQGNTAVLTCQIPPFIQEFVTFTSWERENHKTSETIVENGRYSIYPDGMLHVRDVRRDGSNYRYRCRTQHQLTGESKRSASLGRIIVTEPSGSISPQIVHFIPTIEVRQGEKVRLPCVAQGLPIPTYRWERRREGLSTSIRSGERFHTIDGTLVIRNAQIEDSAIYLCYSNNSVGTEKVETNLSVIAPLSAYIQPERQKVDEGKSATFACTTSGHPVTFVSWVKDGRFLAMDDRVKLLSREILQIEAVRRQDRGMYQCIARNERFSVQAAAELKLGEAEPMFIHTFREQTIHSGNPLSLKCVAYGNPLLMATWTLDDVEISSSNFVNVRDDLVSFVNITKSVASDGGEYKCVMSNRLGSVQHSAKINVYGPPVVRMMLNVSSVAGRDATLRCKTAGYPIDSIRWEKDGQMLPTNHRQKIFPNGTLIIQQINRLADAGFYSCIALNRQGQSAQRSVYLSVLNAPVINPFSFPANLRDGVRAGVQCLIIEGDQPIVIAWLKDGAPLPTDIGITSRTIDDLTRSLIINSITPTHSGNYTCVASNAADSVTHTAQLLVNVPPKWKSEPKNSTVLLHKTHNLDCLAEGSPPPTITWKKAVGRSLRDYKLVSQSSINVQEARNGSLLINKGALESHEGHYLCQASNGVGPELSKVVYLDVLVPAYFEEKLRNQSAIKGKDAVLSCVAKGDEPLTIRWKIKDKIISSNLPRYTIKEKQTHGLTSELHISNLEQKDTNVYHCETSNAYGQDASKIYLLVKEPPESPKDPAIGFKNSRSAHISWKSNFDGNSPITNYIVQYRLETESWDQGKNTTTLGGETSAIIKGLRPANKYQVRVFAENGIGLGASSDVVTIETDEEAPEGAPLDVQVEALDSTSLKVTWKPPPRELWNGAIEGYRIGYREEASKETSLNVKTIAIDYESMPLEYRLGDLSKFTKYIVVAEAYNAKGIGPKTEEIVGTTMEDVPSESPYNVKCLTLSSTSITVEWEPPSTLAQHGTILGYRITFAADKTKESAIQTANILSKILENLMKFTNYSIKILAFNRAGDGRYSESVSCRTDEDVPGPPATIKALVMSSDAILLSWRPPTLTNGIITKYTAYIRINGQAKQKAVSHTVPPTQLYYECRGLQEENHYEFWITASTSVGEGEGTIIVNQSPTSIVPAKIASFPHKIYASTKSDVKLDCRAVGIPTPDREWQLRGKKIPEKSRFRLFPDGSLVISNTKIYDSGNYTCRVINIYAFDEIYYDLFVKGSDQDVGTPSAPVIEVKGKTLTSISLTWSMEENDLEINSPITGYTFSYRENSDGWKEMLVDPNNNSYTFQNLRCGTHYEFFAVATNQAGNSEPSEVIFASTQGTAPGIPKRRDAFLNVNSTNISIDFKSWADGGCPINDFIIEYRLKGENDWKKMVHNARLQPHPIHIGNLRPGSEYTLKVTSRNDAGGTTNEYDVTTLAIATGKALSDFSTDKASLDLLNYLDLKIIIPVATIASIIILSIVITCSVFQCKRYIYQKSGGSARHVMRTLTVRNSTRRREMEMSSPETTVKEDTDKITSNSNNIKNYCDSAIHDDVYPYATYQLPTSRDIEEQANMQLRTFAHVKSTSNESWQRSNSVDSVVSTTMVIYAKQELELMTESNLLNASKSQTVYKLQTGDSLSSHQLTLDRLSPSTTTDIPNNQSSHLVPSAPPAELECCLSGSDDTSDSDHLKRSYQHRHRRPHKRTNYRRSSKLSPLQKVPDLLYHQHDSSSTSDDSYQKNDDQDESEPSALQIQRIVPNTIISPANYHSMLLPDNQCKIAHNNEARPGSKVHLTQSKYFDNTSDGHKLTDGNCVRGSNRTGNGSTAKRKKSAQHLAAEEEELIAQLKR